MAQRIVVKERHSNPRGPLAVYSALTVVLVVLVAALSLTARQPAPPAIAEFAPQARHQIRQAPLQQTSTFGNAPGSVGGGGATTTTTMAPGPATTLPNPPVTVNVPAVKHCVGNPPRQILDTQSPPCVAYWVGNNGGATSMGVTGNEIRVMANNIQNDKNNSTRVTADLQTFFNRYFEFYGRQLNLIPINDGGGITCAQAKVEADSAVTQYKPFAATTLNNTGEVCLGTELARHHVIEASFQPNMSQATMASFAPYLWEYPMSEDDQLARVGQFVCGQLAAHAASHSTDPAIASATRKFGLILEYLQTPYPYSTAPLTGALARCGVTLAASETWEDQETSTQESDAAQFSNNAVLAMKNAHVTTVLCFCAHDDGIEASIAPSANAQRYFPEWLVPWSNDANSAIDTFWTEANQRQALMGMTVEPAQVPFPEMTLNWALQAVDPGFQINTYTDLGYQQFYWELLLIASGIQMAGPDLTPATFQQGLQQAAFPNPPSAQQEGAVGFAGGSHSMTEDHAVMWWSNTTLSPYPDEGPGAWCYVNGGQRFTASTWTVPMSLFAGACDASPPGS